MNTLAQTLENKIHRQLKPFTAAEAAAVTGLSIDEAKDAIDELMKRYACRLQLTENGDLIYDFGQRLRRRDAKSFAEIRREVLSWLWKVFKVIYKAWITVTLVVYFVIFIIITILILIAATSQRGDSRGRGSRSSAAGAINLGRLLELFFSIFRWNTRGGGVSYRTDRQGYPYRHYQPRPGVIDPAKKNFISSVYDFVFGPEPVKADPLSNHKEVAEYLRTQKGVVVTAELQALAGWDAPRADVFFTDCLARFQGEAQVSENGAVYGQFDQLLRGTGYLQGGKIEYYWDEYEPEYELNGNKPGHNLFIGFMNLFNLGFSFLFASGLISALADNAGMRDGSGDLVSLLALSAASSGAVSLLLGWIPLIFSLLFFLIPLLRGFKIRKQNRRRVQNNIRKRLYKAIFENRGKPLSAAEFTALVNNPNASVARLSEKHVAQHLETLVLDLKGETAVSDAGQITYAFPLLTLELREIEQLRRERRVDTSLGNITMDEEV